jgi:hypothetical protein
MLLKALNRRNTDSFTQITHEIRGVIVNSSNLKHYSIRHQIASIKATEGLHPLPVLRCLKSPVQRC